MAAAVENRAGSGATLLQQGLSHPARKSVALYCLIIALSPLIAVIGSVFIARSAFYVHHQRNSYLAISDYPFTLKSKNCDVVVYGDSSALTGISPLVIESLTSLRTCNIAQPNTALAIVGTFALDSYLANNAPPRFLVFQFTAPDFAPRDSHGSIYEEGALQLVRHRLDLQTMGLFAQHPLQSLEFSQFVLRTALIDRDRTTFTYDRAWAEVQATHGLFTSPAGPLDACAGSLEVRAPNPSWIHGLRTKYSRPGTRVLVYVAPYPDCDASYDFYSAHLLQLADNKLQRFNIHFFNEQNHFTRAGAELNSKRLADDLKTLVRN